MATSPVEVPAGPSSGSEPLSSVEPVPASESSPVHARRGSAASILVASAIVLPLASIPYLFLRGRLVKLQKQLADVHAANTTIRCDLRAALTETAKRRTQGTIRMTELLENATRELAALRSDVAAGPTVIGSALKATVKSEVATLQEALRKREAGLQERERDRREWEEGMRREMLGITKENRATRAQTAMHMKELGRSLADVAAFIHEVELRQGYVPRKDDGRGIERIRQLAKKLHEVETSMIEDQRCADGATNESTNPKLDQAVKPRA